MVNLRKVQNSRGAKFRDKNTGRFVKNPRQNYFGKPTGAWKISEKNKKCPKKGINGKVIGFVSFKGGVVLGIIAKVEIPLYPEFSLRPKPSIKTGFGIGGAEIRAGAIGSITSKAPIADVFEIFAGL